MTEIINAYLNQTATWHRATGQNNEYGEPIFANPVSIKVRWEDVRELFRDNEGRETVSNAKVLCAELVKEGDLLEYDGREWPVRKVFVVPWLDGKVTHREVVV
jgi:hypothetical protein